MSLEWNHRVRPVVSVSAPTEPMRGQGLYSTRWYGWRIIILYWEEIGGFYKMKMLSKLKVFGV